MFDGRWDVGSIIQINREKNRQALAKLGLIPRHCKEIICNLTAQRYTA